MKEVRSENLLASVVSTRRAAAKTSIPLVALHHSRAVDPSTGTDQSPSCSSSRRQTDSGVKLVHNCQNLPTQASRYSSISNSVTSGRSQEPSFEMSQNSKGSATDYVAWLSAVLALCIAVGAMLCCCYRYRKTRDDPPPPYPHAEDTEQQVRPSQDVPPRYQTPRESFDIADHGFADQPVRRSSS